MVVIEGKPAASAVTIARSIDVKVVQMLKTQAKISDLERVVRAAMRGESFTQARYDPAKNRYGLTFRGVDGAGVIWWQA